MKCPLPDNEANRLASLYQLMILDTASESLFDSITALAAELCDTPVALFSLVDSRYQWFKSCHGIAGVGEISRNDAICSYTILQDGLLQLDLRQDLRFSANPLTRLLNFYAGVPVTLPHGEHVGTLSVMSRHPILLRLDQQQALQGLAGVISNALTARVQAIQKPVPSRFDPLTGLLNRSEFEQLLSHSLQDTTQTGLQHALLYIDLDQFKVVNDSCGHAAGDQLLQEVVNEINQCIRHNDTLARLGGDEFGLMLDSCELEPALRVAEHICQRISDYRFNYQQQRFRIGASIGLVTIDNHWPNIITILQAAESACYVAKDSGRNRVHVYFQADQSIESRRGEMQWATRIAEAMEDNQFVLYCQRMTPMHREEGCHGEVLLRLRDEYGMLIAPGEFLPAAERFHLATRIDSWVVREVMHWMHRHSDSLQHMRTLSVNLSGQSISDHQFHEYVVELINTLGLDCSKLCFEITETAAITNLVEAEAFIHTMRQLKVRFSLDDFGSGVSSFGYLKQLQVDYLKIDGQFIRDLTGNPIDQATVKCITEVAKVTGKKTIAEWVENEPVERMLRDMGIDYTQGFLRHQPAPLHHMLDAVCNYRDTPH